LVSRNEQPLYRVSVVLEYAHIRAQDRTYIGYTIDPVRRIYQHNAGKKAGGARRTHDKGPWDMVFIVHGFRCAQDALRVRRTHK
jgi:predicted GIY-YIG superfamily endonuclease